MLTFGKSDPVISVMNLTAKTLFGLENVLAKELEELGASAIRPVNRAVLFTGGKDTLYRINYCARTALSVLMPVGEFRIASKEELYSKAHKISWSDFMDPDNTFSVVPVVNSPLFGHTGYPGLVVKDAIADFFRKKNGRRPSVDTTDPDLIVNLHISNDRVTVSLDSSGLALYKRGYRLQQGPAPLNEVLAAGILKLSGWNGSDPVLDPMCGSGTIPIEAAMIAYNIPPGKFRNSFGFSRWKDFDNRMFGRIKDKADSAIKFSPVNISAGDISERAVSITAANLEKAGLSGHVSVEVADFRNCKSSFTNGYVFLNPPYGQRIKPEDIAGLYSMIGSGLKHNFPGNKAWIITSEKEYLKNIGLKPVAKYKLFNGAIECTLTGYELFKGSGKKPKENKSTE